MLVNLTFAQRALLCAVGGLLHAVALHDWPLLAWFSLAPVAVAVAGQNLRNTLWLGLIMGAFDAVESFGATLYGGGIVLILMACDTSVRLQWCLFASQSWRWGPAVWVVVTAAGVPLAEWLSETFLSPYYWPLSLADSQASLPVLLQIVAYGGPASLNGAMGLFGALLALATSVWSAGRRRRACWIVVGAVCVPSFIALLGVIRLATSPPPQRFANVVSVQGGIPSWAYRDARYVPELEDAIDDAYFGQTLSLALGSADLVTWPETAVRPSVKVLDKVQKRLRHTSEQVGAAIIAGMPLRGPRGELLNGAVLATRDGIATTSAKQRLVPLLEMEYARSPEIGVFDTPVARVGVLVCVESAYVQPARNVVARGAEMIVVLANDSGFGQSVSGRIHARIGALRAVEHGVSVVHAGQYQSTRIFDPYGRVLAESFVPGRAVVKARVPLPEKRGMDVPVVSWSVSNPVRY